MSSVRAYLRASSPALARIARRFVQPRHVILHGFYGAGNVGDEALLQSSLEALRDLPGGLTPLVFCPHPERVEADYGVPALNPGRTRTRDLAGVFARSAAYLLGGGGLLKDYGAPEDRTIERQWLRWLIEARRAGLKTMTWSIGVENVHYPTSEQALREVVGRVDVLTVRDPASRDRLRALGVEREIEVTADPVPALVQHRARRRSRPGRPRVLVCARHWYPFEFAIPDEAVNDRMLDALAQAADHSIEEYGAEVAFLPFRTSSHDDDRAVHRAIRQRMRHRDVALYEDEDPSVEQAVDRIDEADLVLGMRLHASILATSMAVPTVAIAYMPKVTDYMNQIGQGERCLAIEDLSADRLKNLVDQTMEDYERLSEALLTSGRELAVDFSRNRILLDGLLR